MQTSLSDPQHALYIDFEGEQDGPPVLLGVLGRHAALGDDDDFRQYIFDETLQPAGAARPTTHGACHAVNPLEALCRLRRAAESAAMPILAWSSHEQTTIERIVESTGDAAFWQGQVVDAKKLAKRWKRTAYPDVVFTLTRGSGRHALRHYLALIEYPIPTTQQGGLTGQRIRAVRDAMTKRQVFESLTPTQKRKWRSLLEHNWHDCNGLRELMMAISQSG